MRAPCSHARSSRLSTRRPWPSHGVRVDDDIEQSHELPFYNGYPARDGFAVFDERAEHRPAVNGPEHRVVEVRRGGQRSSLDPR